MHETIAPDVHAGRSNRRKKKPKHGEFDGFFGQGSALAGRINKVEDNGAFIRSGFDLHLTVDKAEGEESETAVKRRLDNLGGPRIEGHEDGLEDEMGVLERRDAIKRCAGKGIGVG